VRDEIIDDVVLPTTSAYRAIVAALRGVSVRLVFIAFCAIKAGIA
jgi:hypothetical protein